MISEDMEELMNTCGTRCAIPDGNNNLNFKIQPIRNRAIFDVALIYSVNKSKSIKSKLHWNKMDEDWKNRLRISNTWWFEEPIEDVKLAELRYKLLLFGGEAVCLPDIEEDIDDILKYGQFWIGNSIRMMRGKPSQCHRNSCDLWENNKEVSRICTGYALSEDGLWRQHSWVIHIKSRSNQIIETTEPRVAYYGFVMNTEQCEKFVYYNL